MLRELQHDQLASPLEYYAEYSRGILCYSPAIGEISVPMPAMLAESVSPGFTYVPVALPTPDGVPVEIISPGSSVTKLAMKPEFDHGSHREYLLSPVEERFV